MQGTIETDASKKEKSTSCAGCNKPVTGKIIKALGKSWHKEHFVCGKCKTEFGSGSFMERDGVPYCEKDFHELYSPKCAKCKGPIIGEITTALDKIWHPEHFVCKQCGKQFGTNGFQEHEGEPYCIDDYSELFGVKCKGCSKTIKETFISSNEDRYHPECFSGD